MVAGQKPGPRKTRSPGKVVAAVGQLLGRFKQEIPVPRPDRPRVRALLGEGVEPGDHRMTLTPGSGHASGLPCDVNEFPFQRQRTLMPRHGEYRQQRHMSAPAVYVARSNLKHPSFHTVAVANPCCQSGAMA